MKRKNKLEIDVEEGTVTLKDVQCTGWNRNEQMNDVNSLDVTFRFTKEEGFSPFQTS